MSDMVGVGRLIRSEDGGFDIMLTRDFYEAFVGSEDHQEDGAITASMLAPFLSAALEEIGLGGDQALLDLFVGICLEDEQLHAEMAPSRFEEILTYSLQSVRGDPSLTAPEGSGGSIVDCLAYQGFFQLIG